MSTNWSSCLRLFAAFGGVFIGSVLVGSLGASMLAGISADRPVIAPSDVDGDRPETDTAAIDPDGPPAPATAVSAPDPRPYVAETIAHPALTTTGALTWEDLALGLIALRHLRVDQGGTTRTIIERSVGETAENLGTGIGEVASDLTAYREAQAAAVTTATLTVTGDATIDGSLTAGSLAVADISSGGVVTAPYFTATSTTATSTFAGALAAGNGSFRVNPSGVLTAATGITSSGAITFSDLTGGILYADGTGQLSASSTVAAALIEDAYVRTTGDAMTGNLTMSGTSANIALGSNWLSGDGSDEGVFVDENGRVGIGTASPTAKFEIRAASPSQEILTVVATTSQTAQLLRFEATNGTPLAFVAADGSAEFKSLNLSGAAATLSFSNASGATFQRQTGDGSLQLDLQDFAGASFVIDNPNANTVPMKIDGAPSQVADLQQWRSSNGTVLSVVNSQGDLGIGTTDPGYLLDVAGEARVDGLRIEYTGHGLPNSFTIGGGTVTGTAATAIGIGAAAGGSSTAVGEVSNAGGAAAVAIGRQSVTSGTGSVAVGHGASASGNASIAIGYGAVSTVKALALGNPLDPNLAIANSYFGSSVTSPNPQSHTLNASGGSGTDIAGANLTLAGGRPTGAGVGGYIAFSTAAAGASGTTLRSLTERLRVTDSGNVGIGETAPGSKLSVSGGTTVGAGYDTTAAPTNGLLVEGNVGIGTASPGATLDVAGNIKSNGSLQVVNSAGGYGGHRIGYLWIDYAGGGGIPTLAGNSGTASVYFGGNVLFPSGGKTFGATNNAIGSLNFSHYRTGQALVFNTAPTTNDVLVEAMRISHSGNVGIGTASPSQKLEVNGTARFQLSATGGTGVGAEIFQSGGTAYYSSYNRTTSAYAPLTIYGSTVSLMEGNVGIGETAPGSKLSVSGGATVGAAYATTAAPTNGLLVEGNVGIGTTGPTGKLEVVGGDIITDFSNRKIGFWKSGNTNAGYLIPYDNNGNTQLVNEKSIGALLFSTNGSERVRINHLGNVGIGTTTPASILHVSRNSSTATEVVVQNPLAGTAAVGRFQARNGDAATDAVTLGVVSTAFTTSGGLVQDGGYLVTEGGLSGGLTIGTRSASDIRFYTTSIVDANERMRVTAAGNIGIATSTPAHTLSVAGTVGFHALTGATGAGSLCLAADGEVVYNAASDSCLPSLRETKDHITPLTLNAIDTITALESVSFSYLNSDGRTRYGFIAEDVALVDPLLATYNADGILSGIDDRSMLAVVVKGVQELWEYVTGRFDAQEEQIDQHNEKLDQHDGQIIEHEEQIRVLMERIRKLEARDGIIHDAPVPEEEARDEPVDTVDEHTEDADQDADPLEEGAGDAVNVGGDDIADDDELDEEPESEVAPETGDEENAADDDPEEPADDEAGEGDVAEVESSEEIDPV